jgi:hypothetical protein
MVDFMGKHCHINDIKTTIRIQATCRGPYCLMSYDALALLRKKGLKSRRLQDGLPVEHG